MAVEKAGLGPDFYMKTLHSEIIGRSVGLIS
jgi:hypothetical protein